MSNITNNEGILILEVFDCSEFESTDLDFNLSLKTI